jgi:lipopolysaccharide export LptBFGC system permease protein LptF
MIFIRHRHILRELLRVFIVATVGLTLIMSLGGVLRAVQEYGLVPRQVIHLLVYLIPVCLTFVLPVTALFVSALIYGQFAADNELEACRASGVRMLTLVYPGFSLAILVAIANLLLSFHVMPYFVHLAETSRKADAKQILFLNIQRRGVPYLIYADYADSKDGTLFGTVVIQSEEGKIKRITGAVRPPGS